MTSVATAATTLKGSLELYPGINRFALDLVRNAGAASRFCPRTMEIRRAEPSESLARALKDSNRRWGNDVDGLISEWASGEGVAIIAGQQVGFAGGPLYTLTKIASLLAVQRELGERGIRAIPFFWLATEDHDFAEVASLTLATPHGLVDLRAHGSRGHRPVGAEEVPDSLRRGFLAATSVDLPSWLRPGITFADSFAELVSSYLRGRVVLVDSLLPELRREGSAILKSIARNVAACELDIRNRSSELEAAGYDPQVKAGREQHYSLLYWIDDRGERQPIRSVDGEYRAGHHATTLEDVLHRIESEPHRISTGALGRPLLQDAVFAPAVFVGGPAEVAYYAQVEPLHRRFGIIPPRVALRGHVLVAHQRHLRAADKYQLGIGEVFDDPDQILARREAAAVSHLEASLENVRASVERALAEPRAIILDADPQLRRSIERSSKRIDYQIGKILDRGRRAIARRDQERARAIRRLSETVAPRGTPQDRIIGWITWALAAGDELVTRLVDEIEPDSDSFKIIGI